MLQSIVTNSNPGVSSSNASAFGNIRRPAGLDDLDRRSK